MDTDLRNTRRRLGRLALAAVIGGILTFFMMKAMTSSGPSPNHDPVGASIAPLLAIFVFVVTTGFSHAILSRRRS
jgi:hypothetical protein